MGISSRSFMNLGPEKKKVISDAALDQSLKDSSKYVWVSEFIRQAHISKVSFYIYLRDKRGLYRAVLRRVYEEVGAAYMPCLGEEEGRSCEVSCRATWELKVQEQWRDYASVGREILGSRVYRRLVTEVGMEPHGTEYRRHFFIWYYEETNKGRYSKLGEGHFAHIVGLVTGLLLRTLVVYVLDNLDMEEEGGAVKCQSTIAERALQSISDSERYEVESKEPLFIGTADISSRKGSKEE